MQDANFFFDAGIINGRILQAVAQRFVIQQYPCARRDQRRRRQIPVVNPIALRHNSSTKLSLNCTRKRRRTEAAANSREMLLHAPPKPCTIPAAERLVPISSDLLFQ